MRSIYLYKIFFFLCATLFSINFFELIQLHDYTLDTLFQFVFLMITLYLALFIHTSTEFKSYKFMTRFKKHTKLSLPLNLSSKVKK